MRRAQAPRQIAYLALLALSTTLSACGSDGGGVSSTPTPAPTLAPTMSPSPAPTAAPPPTVNYDTPEYRQSSGAPYHGAITAWQLGATGKNVTLGIVDSGIDTGNPEFAGRIAGGSTDVAGSRGVVGTDDHGTQVALTAAAARNGTGILGIAFDATILMARADTAGSCASLGGCTFSDTAIAKGIDLAVANGAKVINLSLGGSTSSTNLQQAVARAAAAGVVMVVSAGNEGRSTDPGVDPSNPDPFASSLSQAGAGNVIIVGSVNDQGAFSGFSNRAGSEAAYFLSALGEKICCVYENGQIKVSTNASGQQFVTVMNGTSFSAPQVAGAVALLRQAFPNLTAAQVVNLLLATATDAGTVGTDAVYGRGILNIAAAFTPQGATTLAGSTSQVAVGGSTITTSYAMGDAAQGVSVTAVALDSYQRAFTVTLPAAALAPQASPKFVGALLRQKQTSVNGSKGAVSLAFTVDLGPQAGTAWAGPLRLSHDRSDSAQILAGHMVAQLSPHRALAFGFAEGADDLTNSLAGGRQSAFLIATGPSGDLGFSQRKLAALALSQDWRGWRLTASAETGLVDGAPDRREMSHFARSTGHSRFSRFGLSASRQSGPVNGRLAVSWLAEDRSILGAALNSAWVPKGADTLIADLSATWNVTGNWHTAATVREGFTHARSSSIVAPGSNLVSSAWSVAISRRNLLARGDSLSLGLSQPLRVGAGGINLMLPSGWDYATLSAINRTSRLGLAPIGRELDGELAWQGALRGGTASVNLFWRRDPGNVESASSDTGVALGWKTRL